MRLSTVRNPVADFGRQNTSGRIRSVEFNNSIDRTFMTVHGLDSGYGFWEVKSYQFDSVDRIQVYGRPNYLILERKLSVHCAFGFNKPCMFYNTCKHGFRFINALYIYMYCLINEIK